MTHVRLSVGADLFADAIEAQAIEVDRVDWRPPMEGTEADLATVATDPLRAAANAARAGRRARRAGDAGRRRARRPRCSAWAAASSCTPGRRSTGSGPRVRCGAR